MSELNETQADPPVPEELVAYLDGELPPDDCRRVEERLANDENYREQLRDLDQAWEALDSLPTGTVDDDFARTTIEMVALAAQQDSSQKSTQEAAASRMRNRRWAAVAVAAAAVGFLAARMLLPNANARLLADLPVISQLDELQQVKDIDFLRRLSKDVPVNGLATIVADVDRDSAEMRQLASDPAQLRADWVNALKPGDKADLREAAKRFENLSPEDRRRVVGLHREIAAAPDADNLQRTLIAYGQWIARHTSGEQEELRSLATDERVKRIDRMVEREGRQAAQRLSDADAKALREEVFEIGKERRDEFEKAMRRRDNGDTLQLKGQPPARVALLIASWELRNEDTDDRTRKRLVERLSPEAQQHLEQVARRGGDRRKWLLWQWMHDAMQPNLDPAALDKFFATDEDLTPDERQRLLSLPRIQMEAELERMYLRKQFGLQGADWLGSFKPGDGPMMGPPGPGGGPGAGGPGRGFGPPPREDMDRDPRRGPRNRDGQGPRPDRPPTPGDGQRPGAPPPGGDKEPI